MSWSISLIGRDKEKLKAAVRSQQCKDEVGSPHNGVPVRVADFLCAEIDRARIYQYKERTFALSISGNGSFHDQGVEEHVKVNPVELAE